MMIKNLLLIPTLSLVALFSNIVNAKDLYILCDRQIFKITDPLFGDGKIYYDDDDEWTLLEGKVTKDRIIIYGLSYKQCGDAPKCGVKMAVKRLLYADDDDNTYEANDYAIRDCEKMSNNSCKAYKKGKIIRSYVCKLLKNE